MPRLYPFAIGGQLVSPEVEVKVNSPYSGDEVGRCGAATGLEVERALKAAAEARGPLAALPAWRRSQALAELQGAVECNQDELALLMSEEAGKPIRDAQAEVRRGLLTLQTAAEEALRLPGTVENLDV